MIAFYILSGSNYIDQARRSAASIKKHMPNMGRFLFTPDQGVEKGDAFDEIISLPERQSHLWYLDCVHYLSISLSVLRNWGIMKLLFLDSDTLVVEPFHELELLIERFDLVAAHAPGRITCPTVGPIPDCFPELNIGVIGLRNHSELRSFVSDWYLQYMENQDIYGNNDQGSLRETLWIYHNTVLADDFHFYVLPPEYNCRPLEAGVFLNGKVRIIHSRDPNIASLAAHINDHTGMRIWKP